MKDIFTDDGHSIGEFVTEVLSIKDEQSARNFVEEYLRWLQRHPHPEETHTPEQLMRANIGWCFGEGMEDRYQAMWIKVCGASHLIFGVNMPSTEEALKVGMELGRKIAQGHN